MFQNAAHKRILVEEVKDVGQERKVVPLRHDHRVRSAFWGNLFQWFGNGFEGARTKNPEGWDRTRFRRDTKSRRTDRTPRHWMSRLGRSDAGAPKRSGRARSLNSPSSSERKGEAYTPNAATGSGGWPAAKPWMMKSCSTTGWTRRRSPRPT